MPRPVQPRLALAALERAIRSENHCHTARMLGVNRRLIQRYVSGGIPADSAERLAGHLGLRPEEVWDDYDDALEELRDEQQLRAYNAYLNKLAGNARRAQEHRERRR